MLFHFRDHSESSVGSQWEHTDIAAGVVRDEQRSFPAVDAEITRISTLRSLLIQQAQIACRRIDRKRAHSTAGLFEKVADFVHCIKKSSAAIDSEERWVNGHDGSETSQRARIREVVTINAFAFA